MTASLQKYGHVLRIGLQNTLVYRVNFLFRAVFGLIPLIATISLWRSIYAGNGATEGTTLAGYTLAQMVSYYLVVTLVDCLTAVNEDDWQIAAEIKDGQISQFLLKPLDYMIYRLCLFGAGRMIYTSVALIPVAIFVYFQRDHFVFPHGAMTWFIFGGSILLTGMLQFCLSYTMALLAFWVMEVSTFIFILFAFEYLAGGHLFPLDILPPFWTGLLELTPFPYLLYFPVNIFLERITGPALWRGLGWQAGWVVVMFLVARWVWSRGIRKYSAAGG